MSLLFFILLIGPLIFVHELGHFLAARAFKVGVIRFSIGFGPRIAGFVRHGTEYVIGALPLGGYVRLVGSDPTEMAELTADQKPTAFLNKPVWKRMVILLAGPLANLLLPLPIFIAYYMAEEARVPAIVGTVIAGTPADQAGLQPGDAILAIDGKPIRFFDQIQKAVGSHHDEQVELLLRRGEEQVEARLSPVVESTFDPWVRLRTVERAIIGITGTYFGPVIAVDQSDSLAARTGLQTFDRVVRVGDRSITSFAELETTLAESSGVVEVLVFRPVPIGQSLGEMFVEIPVLVSLDLTDPAAREDPILRSAQMLVRFVQAGSPADEAGLRPGDQIVTLDSRPYNSFAALLRTLYAKPLDPHELTFQRRGELLTTQLTAVELEVTNEFKQEIKEVFVGMRSSDSADYYPDAVGFYPLAPMSGWERVVYGFTMGFSALIGFILGIIVGVWQIITREVGLDSLGGPIMIFDIAGRAGQAGLGTFMRMMGLISINLGILNLLPIPVLDGGSLLLFSIEGVIRRPLTARVRQVATYIGLAFILLLFLLVFKNDIERYWSGFVEFFN
ncbi:MAG: site-2 protease family protein [Bradymonadales bacterium]|nr:site-2 protease family protein [Bradymonadales bacterium]